MEPLKVIFLDFDGVLNSYQSTHYWQQKGKDASNKFCPICIAMLNWIMEKTSASIVISSTWGHSFSLAEMKAVLQKNGFLHLERVIDTTPKKLTSCKCHEIGWYLIRNKNKIDTFVIIDDKNISSELDEHLVLTDSRRGLDYFNAVDIVKRLEGTDIEESMMF